MTYGGYETSCCGGDRSGDHSRDCVTIKDPRDAAIKACEKSRRHHACECTRDHIHEIADTLRSMRESMVNCLFCGAVRLNIRSGLDHKPKCAMGELFGRLAKLEEMGVLSY